MQDAIPGERTRLSNIIHRLADLESRSCEEVSLEWFRRYMNISLKADGMDVFTVWCCIRSSSAK